MTTRASMSTLDVVRETLERHEGPALSAGTSRARSRTVDAAVLAALLVLAAVVVWLRLDRGWIAHDEGTLGHTAERVLQGELPHADFDEVYTGGLTFVHAAVFRLFGIDLLHLRVLTYGVFLLTVPAAYYLTRQFFTPAAAGLATLLATTLSFPNYTAAMPSWYLLFASILAAAAFVRYAATHSMRWLVVAGVVVGMACAIKITGLYLLAAVLMHCLFLSQSTDGPPLPQRTALMWSAFVTLCLVTLLAAVVLLVAPRFTMVELVHLVLPVLAVVLLLLHRQWTRPVARAGVRFALAAVGAIAAGCVAVIALLLIPYIRTGTVGVFVHGVFLAPGTRLASAAMSPPAVITVITVLPVAIALAVTRLGMSHRRTAALMLGGLLAILFFTAATVFVYAGIWLSMRWSGPLSVLLASFLLVGAGQDDTPHSATLALLVSLVALTGLNQYPFSAPIYFLYVAPLVALLMGGIFHRLEAAPRLVAGVMALFYTAFTVAWVYPGFVYNMGAQFVYDLQVQPFQLERASITVTEFHRVQYGTLVRLLNEKASNGYVFAGPDSPEVYVLGGFRNPTRHVFEFLAGPGDGATILRELARHDVNVVALNQTPEFSGRFSEGFVRQMRLRYPESTRVGQFEVRWSR
jgi:hypothetical protein